MKQYKAFIQQCQSTCDACSARWKAMQSAASEHSSSMMEIVSLDDGHDMVATTAPLEDDKSITNVLLTKTPAVAHGIEVVELDGGPSLLLLAHRKTTRPPSPAAAATATTTSTQSTGHTPKRRKLSDEGGNSSSNSGDHDNAQQGQVKVDPVVATKNKTVTVARSNSKLSSVGTGTGAGLGAVIEIPDSDDVVGSARLHDAVDVDMVHDEASADDCGADGGGGGGGGGGDYDYYDRKRSPPSTERERGGKGTTSGAVPYKYVEPIRKKAERDKLPGHECEHCARFYDAISGGAPELRRELVTGCSRHKHLHTPPGTPPGYWDMSFPGSPDVISPSTSGSGTNATARLSRRPNGDVSDTSTSTSPRAHKVLFPSLEPGAHANKAQGGGDKAAQPLFSFGSGGAWGDGNSLLDQSLEVLEDAQLPPAASGSRTRTPSRTHEAKQR
jgi:hypothetical protein